MEQLKRTESNHRSPPADTAWLFPEYEFATIQIEAHRGVIIERFLEKGSWEQLCWLFSTYDEESVAGWVRQHGFRLLSKRSFALWRLVLDIHEDNAPAWAATAKEMELW